MCILKSQNSIVDSMSKTLKKAKAHSQHESMEHLQKNFYGILYMLLNAVAISVLYAAVKELRVDLDSNLVVFIYKFSLFVLILPWVLKDGLKSIKTDKLLLHCSRGFLSISGSLCLFYAIKYIELSDITAIGYIEQVLLVLVGILFFKEKSSFAKILGIFMSFLGAVVVIYPDMIQFSQMGIPYLSLAGMKGEPNKYYIFVFLSIFFWGSNCVVIKCLGKTEKTKAQMFYVLLVSCILTYPLAFFNWEDALVYGMEMRLPTHHYSFADLGLSLHHLPYLALLSLCYFIHSVAFYKSLTYSEFSTVIPFDYTRLIFTGIFGYLFYSEMPETGSYFGYLFIVVSGIILVRSEAKRRKIIKKQQIQQLEEEYEHA